MYRSAIWLALSGGLLLLGCARPCQTTAQCGSGEYCVAAACQALSCEEALFATDPKSGACVALSGCFLTEEQRGWQTCQSDACRGLGEGACLDDRRCQPAYENPEIQLSANPGTGQSEPGFCAGGVAPQPNVKMGGPVAPGVNNGEAPKHPVQIQSGCFANNQRRYAGCRAVPQIAAQKACTELTTGECQARRDCSTSPPGSNGGGVTKGMPTPVPPGIMGAPADGNFKPAVCFDLHPRSSACAFADKLSCLTNPECQAIRDKGGTFAFCEPNDHLRRCQSSAECKADERCDNDEACIAPRTFTAPLSNTAPVPGTGSCTGACVPRGCAGFGAGYCSDHPECDSGSYGTVCHPQPYCGGSKGDPMQPPPDPNDPGLNDPNAGPGVGNNCGCETAFLGCAPQPTLNGLRPDRSLLVRDPAILGDPLFQLGSVLRRLTGKDPDLFVQHFLEQFGTPRALGNKSVAQPRKGIAVFVQDLKDRNQLTLDRFASLFHVTALIDRLDLATAGNCGEARISYAMDSGYDNGHQRMTMIVELSVPDDGQGCRTVAQQWGELSLVDDLAEQRKRLAALYAALLPVDQPGAHLGQLRTNEFFNADGLTPWELREWHLIDGLLELSPVKQTVAPEVAQTQAFKDWVKGNLGAIKAGTVTVPAEYLGAASTENGGRLRFAGKDRDLADAEKQLNALSCAGCHLTETKSPFVHIGERLGKRAGAGYKPEGRAVIDEFLRKDLDRRAQNLAGLLMPTRQALTTDFRLLSRARVH